MISCLRPWFSTLFRNVNFRNLSFKSDEHSRIPISFETLNPYVKNVEYAVRGPVPSRALEIESELINGSTHWPFEKLIYTNIGDPQNLGQLALTFPRQLLALCSYPALISDSNLMFPNDVKNRAQFILDSIGSFGGYTHSLGLSFIRDNVESFLSKRDGYKSTSSTIILSDGASKIISVILSCLNNVYDSPSGVMIPIPQYPLYSACLSYYGLIPIPYYLDEDSHWGLNLEELRISLLRVKGKCVPRALVVINPGNPTGQCLDSNQQEEIIEFSIKNNLLLLADEVYQDNVYDNTVRWSSFRKCFLKNQVNNGEAK